MVLTMRGPASQRVCSFPHHFTGPSSLKGAQRYPLDKSVSTDWLKQISHAVRLIRGTTQFWVVTRHQNGISELVFQTFFRGETSSGVVECRLFSQASLATELKPVFSP